MNIFLPWGQTPWKPHGSPKWIREITIVNSPIPINHIAKTPPFVPFRTVRHVSFPKNHFGTRQDVIAVATVFSLEKKIDSAVVILKDARVSGLCGIPSSRSATGQDKSVTNTCEVFAVRRRHQPDHLTLVIVCPSVKKIPCVLPTNHGRSFNAMLLPRFDGPEKRS